MIPSFFARGMLPAVLLAASAHSAAVTITVTTTADQDGSDSSRCSLREAVKAVNTSMAYGGCPAGLFRAQNTIQLKAGTYALDRELVITEEVTILGADTFRTVGDSFGTTEGNLLTGSDTKRIQPRTIIKPAVGRSIRLINASGASSGVELVDLVLEGGSPSSANPSLNYGGAILSSASLVVDNVRIRNNSASRGGAIYLAGSAGLVMTDSELSGNQATETGGAVAMSCYSDGSVSRSLSVNRSSFRLNAVDGGATAGAGVMQMCGNVTASFFASTLSANTSTAGGGALYFKDDFGASQVSFTLEYVTAAENQGAPVIASSGPYKWTLRKTIFAANADGNCSVTDANANCSEVDPMATSSSYVADNALVSADLSVFAPAGYQLFGGLTGGYLPALGSSIHDVITGCQDLDQRGLNRENVAKCDIGALERLQLTAVDDRAVNKFGDGRVAYVDVLANDSFEEDGLGSPTITKPVSFEIVDKSASELSSSRCDIDVSEPLEPKLVVDNLGEVTSSTSSIKCYYRVKNSDGVLVGEVATVDISISNFKPVARDDSYERSVGEAEIVLDLLANDDDEGDGDDATPRESLVIMIRGDRPGAGMVKTQLGTVIGNEVDCEAVTGDVVDGAVCFRAGKLVYRADNSISPFTEEFEYSVYDMHPDEDPLESNKATVTISTDAPNPDKKGGGSFDWILLCLAAMMAGLRLSRRV